MLVYFAILLTTLLGFCGLAIDMGRVELRAVQLQAVADAGAIAAAQEALHGTASNYAVAANYEISTMESLNGIPTTASVVMAVPTSDGAYALDYSTIEITITQSIPTLFLGLISQATTSATVTVKAVAEIPPCFNLMGNPGVNNGFSAGGFGYYLASAGTDSSTFQCPLYATTGVGIDGFGRIGGIQVRNSGAASASWIGGSITLPALYNVPLTNDPLAYVTAPTAATCANNSTPLSYTSSAALTPNTYCGKTTGTTTTPALTMTGTSTTGVGAHCTSNPVLSLSPGLYIFVGGVSFNCATITGSGVTMYFTRNQMTNYGMFYLTSSTWNVSAPADNSSGGIPGIVLFGDRAWSGGNEDFQFYFSTWSGDGVIYLTNTGVYDWNSSMSAPNYLNLVVANMYTYASEVNPSINYANLPGGSPLHTTGTLVQ